VLAVAIVAIGTYLSHRLIRARSAEKEVRPLTGIEV
jgi:hypothetical protein